MVAGGKAGKREAGESARPAGPRRKSGGRAGGDAPGPRLPGRGRERGRKTRPAEEERRRRRWAPRAGRSGKSGAEGEAQGAAGPRGPKPGPREAPPQIGPTGGEGPGPGRAPSRLTQWPRHAGRACTCSRRLLADMALGSSRVAAAAGSPQSVGGGG